MKTKHIKFYTGSSILVNRLQNLLKEVEINSIIKDHVNSGKMVGFGPLGQSIELFILNSDLEKANPILEKFIEKINS